MQQTVINPKNKKQGGYTLVELAIAVAILAVLIVAGLTGVQGILTSSKVNDQIKTVAKLSSKVSAAFASGATSGINTATLANLGGWEASKVNGGVPRSSFSTNESVASNTAALQSMPANGGFYYLIPSVPSAACPDLANGIGSMAYALYLQAGNSNPNGAPNAPPANTVVKAPDANTLNTTNLAAGCALAATVDFVIALKP